MNLTEYDIVKAARILSKNIPAGSIGTVLFVGEVPLGYMVEFMKDGESLDVLTVAPEDIELVGTGSDLSES